MCVGGGGGGGGLGNRDFSGFYTPKTPSKQNFGS